MTSPEAQPEPLSLSLLESVEISDWEDIDHVLDRLRQPRNTQTITPESFSRLAFFTSLAWCGYIRRRRHVCPGLIHAGQLTSVLH